MLNKCPQRDLKLPVPKTAFHKVLNFTNFKIYTKNLLWKYITLYKYTHDFTYFYFVYKNQQRHLYRVNFWKYVLFIM